jgi:hypothetical protein
MFESHNQPLLSGRRFIERTTRFLLAGAAIDLLMTAVGAFGFRLTVGVHWLDAFVDGALVMTGNGPRHFGPSATAKLFLYLFALFGGTVYVVVVGLILTPAAHRLFHAFHLRGPDDRD